MKHYLRLFLVSVLLSAAFPAYAFWGLAIDPYPMPDFVDEAVSYMQSAADLANNTQKTIKTTEDNLNNLKTAAMSVYGGELSTLIDSNSVNPGQKPMENCIYLGKQYKNTSADNVYDLVKILFLQYPGADTQTQSTYDSYRDEFYKDTVMEIFTAAGEMQLDMENRVRPSIDETIECVKGDMNSCGTPPPDGNTDAVFVEGKAFEAIDNLYTVLLKATALKAQLIAAKTIHKNRPLPYVEGVKDQTADTSAAAEEAAAEAAAEDGVQEQTQSGASSAGSAAQEQAALVLGARIYASATLHHGEQLAFAQLGLAQSGRDTVSSLARVETAVTLSNDSSQQYVDDTLTFVSAPASPEVHPYIYEEDKMDELDKVAPADEIVGKAREVHNLIHSLGDYKNAAESMLEMREKYEKALKSLKTADNCARNYIGRHFSNPGSVWGSASNVTDYDSRSGISGWALKAYEAAKAAETTETSTGDVVALNIDYESEDLSDPTDTEKNLEVINKQGSVSPGKSKEEKSAAEARQSQLLPWQIGAEASKMLAAEPEKWGAPSKNPAFPVWQDTKSFYNQYLDLKYANIKSYLKSFSSSDVLAVVAERLKGGSAEVDDTLRRQKADMVDQKLAAEIAGADQSGQQALSGYESSYLSRLAALQTKRQNIVSRLDNASAKLKSDRDELSDLRSQAQDDAGTAMRESVTARETFPSAWNGEASGTSAVIEVEDYETRAAAFDENVSENKTSSGIENLERQIDSQKQTVSSLESQMAAVDAEIKAFRLEAQSGISGIRDEAEAAKVSLSEQAAELIANSDASYQKDVKSALLSILRSDPSLQKPGLLNTPEMIYAQLEDSAAKALNTLYAQVDRRVDQARAQLSALGENLYNPDYHRQVEQIHQSMINDIRALAISVSASGISSVSGIQMYAKLLSADTAAETEDYFVGRPARERDLRAPKMIFSENLPPLREMFHFDEVDFQNVKPFVEGRRETSAIINADFLNVGSEIPLVWQYMLRNHAYVEADMDLNAALNSGCAQVSFFRGGAMPCRVKDSALVVDTDKEGNYIRSSASGSLPECSYLEVRSGAVYHTFREVTINLGSSQEAAAADCAYSELGTLFKADKSGSLLFRQPTYDAYYALLYELNHSDEEQSSSAKRRLAAYDRAPLAFNQIGEFLIYAENEQNMRQQLEELQEQYDAMMDKLFALLREYGYEPSSGLDLSRESDYNLVRNKLDNIKNQAVSEALSQIAEINVENNEVVAERVEELQGIITALQKDKDEMTIISGAVDDQNNLDEEIKTSKVNEEVAGKFVDSLNKASAGINLPEAPYCAVY